ncbi:hypothetical protein BCR39DRAFT_545711 [Naematelia encephala]|uniref:Thioredoxin-like fold domain-containing protein n=1 Tax=Naematelia encephala TaxID=71784 RepID=A0A1Y2ASF0_9TREE|nr:hypothetical protein BCR39DRAFT_545711 [Naematelia encephala]
MALPRTLSFLRQGTGSQVLEVYLDPLCPFSAKIEKSLTANVIPHLSGGGKYDGKLSVIARLYPQPFHYMSAIVVEAMIVFGQLYPNLFWPYTTAIFDNQRTFFNVPANTLTPNTVRDQLSEIAVDVLEKNGKLGQGPKSQVFGQFRDKIDVKASSDGHINGGNDGTVDMKYLIKLGRQNAVHVTPTAFFDGLKDDSVSSSWGKEEWDKYLTAKL